MQAAGNVPVPDQARRLRQVRDGYGLSETTDLIAAVLRQQERMITSSDRARQADPRTADLHMAARNWALADRSLLFANTTVFRRELASDA